MSIASFVTGLTLSLSLIVAIGAQNTFVLRQGLRREHVAAVVTLCVLLDVALMTLGVGGLAASLGRHPRALNALALAGALLLAAYGTAALWRAWRPRALQTASPDTTQPLARVLTQALAISLLNPHVYLDTVLLVGSTGAQYGGSLKVWFVAGSALASALWFSALGFGARWLAPVFARPRAWQMLDALIGGTMLVLAALLARRALLGA